MTLYITGYQNPFVRFLHDFFVRMPLMMWFRFFSRLIPRSATFVNYSSASYYELIGQWRAAQKNLATAPFPLDAGAPGLMRPPDPRALTVVPKNVTVIAVPDVPISDLIKVNPGWSRDEDPSGSILIMQNNGLVGYQTCHAVTMPWARPRVYAAFSEIPAVLVYEFENIILSRLGYDVSNR